MIILLISILVYLSSVIVWFFIIYYEERHHCYTIGDVLDKMYDTVSFIPIVNTVFILVWGVIYVVVSLKIHSPFVKLWNKFKDIKLK